MICYRVLRFPQGQWFFLCKDLHRYWPPEHCIKQWYDKRKGYVCLSEKCGLGEQWSSDSFILYLIQVLWCAIWKHIDSPHQPYSPFTQQITLCFLYCISVLLALCHIINIHCCHKDMKLWIRPSSYHPHTGFHISKFLSYLSYDLEALPVFQAWIWVWVHIGKCLISSQIRHMVRLFEF